MTAMEALPEIVTQHLDEVRALCDSVATSLSEVRALLPPP